MTSISIDCPRPVRTAGVAARGDSFYAALTTTRVWNADPQTQIARLDGPSGSLTPLSGIADGRFVAGDSQPRIAAVLNGGTQLFSEQLDGQWAPSTFIAPPTDDVVVGAQVLAAADSSGTTHVVWTRGRGAGLVLASSDGSSADVSTGPVTAATLAAGATGPVRVFFFIGLHLLSWTKADGATSVLDLGSPPESAWMTATADGSAVGLVLNPATPGGIGASLTLLRAGPTLMPVWQDQLRSVACDGQMTVLNPDICPSERREDAVGTVLLAHAVVTDAKGSPWVALVTGEATQLCRWVAVSGCFETLPCDCRRMAQQNYRPTLRLFRAPNFSTPVAELPLAEARNIALSADSAGNRAGVLLADPDRYDQNARLLIFDLDGA